MIAAGIVLVSGSVAEKASRLVAPDEPIEVVGPPRRFVSRGGEKLDAALERFRVVVDGLRALDAGASTGGFTDCLLQRGAVSVAAVDVGRGQLHEKLRADPRVEVLERTHILDLRPDRFGGQRFGIVAADLSFISLTRVAGPLVDLTAERGHLIMLVKPQFEAGRQEASRARGVIKEPAIWRRVLEEVITAFRVAGAAMMGVMPSPLRGAEGNVEFLVWLTRDAVPSPGPSGGDIVAIEAAITEAASDGAGSEWGR